MSRLRMLMVPVIGMLGCGCVTLKHQIDQSKPLEINVNVRLIDDRLNDFYAFEKQYQKAPATQPAS